MLLSKKIKLEVSEQDAATLEFMQGKCRGLYNWWVMQLRDGQQWSLAEAKKSLQASKRHDPELKYVYGKLLQEVYFRIDNAMQAFFRRVKAGETPGFPRVRPRHCFFTLCYPAMYIKIEGDKLILPSGGGGKHGPKRFPNIVARLTEAPPEHFKEVAISRDAIRRPISSHTNWLRELLWSAIFPNAKWSRKHMQSATSTRTVQCSMIGDATPLCRCLSTSACFMGKNSCS